MQIDFSEMFWPVAIVAIVAILTMGAKSCSEHANIEGTKKTQTYLDRGCGKTAIPGSTGTHWVCDGSKQQR
jgi:hypothetical protein